MANALFLGIDIGTSGVRACLIDDDKIEVARQTVTLPAPAIIDGQILQDSQLWLKAVESCLTSISDRVDLEKIRALSVDGTSSTLLLCLDDGHPLTAAVMYNDTSATSQAERIAQIAPVDSGAHGASSSLAKVLHLREMYPQLAATRICHQADYVTSWLSGRYGISDENNCLKLGYDAVERCWSDWLQQLDIPTTMLPEVTRPGTTVANIDHVRAKQFGINTGCNIVSGTTDSIAAFIASGADKTGDAVTSLGSTLVVKQLTETPVFSAEHGVYSHRYYASDELWLAGGASNSGCYVLNELFTQQQIDDMSLRLHPDRPTGLEYYPLPLDARGERFPIADPERTPILQPRPDDDVEYFQGILESIAELERRSYKLLEKIGCGKARQIYTAGGGSHNRAWNTIRQNLLGIPVSRAPHTEACYGSALLARHGYYNDKA